MVKLNMYLETPLLYELDQNPDATESSRLYLDGDTLTLADCNLLPKLNIIKVSRVYPYSVLSTLFSYFKRQKCFYLKWERQWIIPGFSEFSYF